MHRTKGQPWPITDPTDKRFGKKRVPIARVSASRAAHIDQLLQQHGIDGGCCVFGRGAAGIDVWANGDKEIELARRVLWQDAKANRYWMEISPPGMLRKIPWFLKRRCIEFWKVTRRLIAKQ